MRVEPKNLSRRGGEVSESPWEVTWTGRKSAPQLFLSVLFHLMSMQFPGKPYLSQLKGGIWGLFILGKKVKKESWCLPRDQLGLDLQEPHVAKRVFTPELETPRFNVDQTKTVIK